jgi:thermitase
MFSAALMIWMVQTAEGKTLAPPDWGRKDVRLQAPTANSSEVIVAVIDTGADLTHPLLKNSLWRNPGESGADSRGRDRGTNGIDDDRNGFIDDVHGWDFVRNRAIISDGHGHGTHIAGIIAVSAPRARLMILRYFDIGLPPLATIDYTVAAVQYATKMGARIINYSAGGPTFSRPEFAALEAAAEKNILVVAAAGNEGRDSSHFPYFPANYPLSNILSVTAHNPRRQVLTSSNFGKETVDLSAPGEKVGSALPGGGYGEMTGTSQATAFGTGVAAMVWGQFPALSSPQEVIDHLMITGIQEDQLKNITKSGARLDALRALRMAPMDGLPMFFMRKNIDRAPSSPTDALPLAKKISQRLSRHANQTLTSP